LDVGARDSPILRVGSGDACHASFCGSILVVALVAAAALVTSTAQQVLRRTRAPFSFAVPGCLRTFQLVLIRLRVIVRHHLCGEVNGWRNAWIPRLFSSERLFGSPTVEQAGDEVGQYPDTKPLLSTS